MIIHNNNTNSWLSPFMAQLFDTPMIDADLKLVDRPMRTDVIESDNDFIMQVEVAGYSKDQISVELDDGYLVISAEVKPEEAETANGKFIRRERALKSIKRSFYIGDETIDQENISAKVENGVLQLTLPKKAPLTQEKKKIQVI